MSLEIDVKNNTKLTIHPPDLGAKKGNYYPEECRRCHITASKGLESVRAPINHAELREILAYLHHIDDEMTRAEANGVKDL